ncbi:hypothetical protein NHQ30_009079 [Ciborinia camelliae]|nr:hypothetical protein NHQ30_009079 [Ciborinia camelliae]
MAEHSGAVPPIDIINYTVQTPKQRFSETSIPEDVLDTQTSIHELPSDAKTTCLYGAPRPAFWRMNLVALSQKYNMYFAAYMDTIHVTRPRTLKQILPGVPDLILRLPKSKDAGDGHLDISRPHAVNNLMIGNLGDKEILLFCADDGDVAAYYTDLLAEEIQQAVESTASSIPIGSTTPFFLENVGISAWGLAIHQNSRLIAVSSNRHEVTVFVHGTNRNKPGDEPCNCAVVDTVFDPLLEQFARLGGMALKSFPNQGCHSRHFVYKSDGSFANSLFPLRISANEPRSNNQPCSRNFRIIIKPDGPSHNIPAIAFADDKKGFAESIIATDILGNMFLLGIWHKNNKLIGMPLRTRGAAENPQMSVNPLIIKLCFLTKRRGWGVMTIPMRYFRHSPNFQDALGMEDLKSVWDDSVHNRPGSSRCLNITSSMRRVELFPRILQDSSEQSGNPPMPDNFEVDGVELDGDELNQLINEAVDREHRYHLHDGYNPNHFERRLIVDEIDEMFNNDWSQGRPYDFMDRMDRDATLADRIPFEYIRHTYATRITNSESSDELEEEEYFRSDSPPNQLGGLSYFRKDHSEQNNQLKRSRRSVRPSRPNRFMKKVESLVLNSRRDDALFPMLSDGSTILRTWEDSIELVPSFNHIPPAVCSKGFFRQGTPRAFGQSFREIARINMMALIPELSLVVVASQNGQAALLTLTKVDINSSDIPVPTFRIEALLPPRKYGENYLIGYDGPKPPLLGLAVSPIQRGPGIELNAGESPKKWRLIMHSYDQTIWTYELSRDENDDLLVF